MKSPFAPSTKRSRGVTPEACGRALPSVRGRKRDAGCPTESAAAALSSVRQQAPPPARGGLLRIAPRIKKWPHAPMSTSGCAGVCRAKTAPQTVMLNKTPCLSLRLSGFASSETDARVRASSAVLAQNHCRPLRLSAPHCATQELWLRNIERQTAPMAHSSALPPHQLAIHSRSTAKATHDAATQSMRATTIQRGL